jgi:hypothetical protein
MMGTPHTGGGTTYGSNSQGNVAGGGYSYQLWSNGVGSGSMTVYGVDAQFSAKWSNVGDFLARVGLGWSSTKTYTQLGTISADFAETKTGSAGGFSYIGIYGWSENPLHEYYIVEDWFGARPVPGTVLGTIAVDGGMYDVPDAHAGEPACHHGRQRDVRAVLERPEDGSHVRAHLHLPALLPVGQSGHDAGKHGGGQAPRGGGGWKWEHRFHERDREGQLKRE